MDFQEQFFKERIKFIHEARAEKEESFEKLQQQEREKVKQSNPNPSNAEEYRRRADEIEKFIKFQDEEMQAFVAERDKLIKAHEKKMVGMRERHWQEEVELEKEFDAELSHLMEKYTLDGSKSMPAILDCGIVGECDGFLKSCSTVTFQKILNLKKFDLWETMLCQLGGQMDLAKSLPMISSR
ncbi:protein SUPPRESSOR OF GENE SILENCING 3 isoform X1 [Gossypium hirsutum]|uniref:Protein SUPPRESSOR OF GENE SILENCING 3 isoform X1 n=1 Tax=Gossypium hirsutum TaxID=3635 RepID=A0ABM3AU20_GOSHI|nr:protein SUPPRESSOR OF GENE SILENCING 3-like isoform X1 [Gossypium hirsutum]